MRYSGRLAPHIHFKVKRRGQQPWTTQLYMNGDAGNDQDEIYRGIGGLKARESVTADFTPMQQSTAGEWAARFDIVLGVTPPDGHLHQKERS